VSALGWENESIPMTFSSIIFYYSLLMRIVMKNIRRKLSTRLVGGIFQPENLYLSQMGQFIRESESILSGCSFIADADIVEVKVVRRVIDCEGWSPTVLVVNAGLNVNVGCGRDNARGCGDEVVW
jgi:hypothetical protein